MKTRQVFYYVGFGVLHEAFHVLAAYALCRQDDSTFQIPSMPTFLRDALLGKYVELRAMGEEKEGMVRHAGWILSLLMAILLFLLQQYQSSVRRSTSIKSSASSIPYMAAAIVALEAISTDLFQLGVVNNLTTSVFFCGNFGAILLHQNWNDSDTVFVCLTA